MDSAALNAAPALCHPRCHAVPAATSTLPPRLCLQRCAHPLPRHGLPAGSVRPPSVQPTRLTGSPAAAKRTQQGSSSSSSSGSGTTRRTRLARAAAPSRLANVSKGCTKPRRSSTVAAWRQAVLQAKRQPQEAALAHVQRQPAAVVVNARSADRLRRVIVMRALVSALLQAPAIAPARYESALHAGLHVVRLSSWRETAGCRGHYTVRCCTLSLPAQGLRLCPTHPLPPAAAATPSTWPPSSLRCCRLGSVPRSSAS